MTNKLVPVEDSITSLRNDQLVDTVNPYLAAATSPNTRRAYQADVRHFENWGGHLPTHKEQILLYLQCFAGHLNPRTLARRLTALKNWHVYQGFADPTSHPAIVKTLIGIKRTHGEAEKKAPALLTNDLIQIVECLKKINSLRPIRDSALLQLAFLGAFRGSEVIALQVEDIQWQTQGIDILVRSSKTDQLREGQYCAIPNGNSHLCAVRALQHWLQSANIVTGFIFRRLYNNDRLADEPLSSLSVSNILRKWATKAQLEQPNKYSSHSLRRGLATAASHDNASMMTIMRHGRWKDVNTVMKYIEAAKRFEDNAAKNVLRGIE